MKLKYLSITTCILYLDFSCAVLFIVQMKLLIAGCIYLIMAHIKMYKTLINTFRSINQVKREMAD